MEYKIFKLLRHKIYIPFFIRFIFGVFCIFISSIPIILPIFPWSFFLWIVLLVIWILVIVPWKKVRHVVKIRKGLYYLVKNFHKKKTIKYKIRDIKIHVKDILKNK